MECDLAKPAIRYSQPQSVSQRRREKINPTTQMIPNGVALRDLPRAQIESDALSSSEDM